MLLNCCYRLQMYGEIIHSVWDTDKMEIVGMPKDFFDLNTLTIGESFSAANYHGVDTDFKAACEAILMSDDEFVIVLEYLAVCYICITIHGNQLNKKAPTTLPTGTSVCGIPGCGSYKNLGYRVTRPVQVRESAGIYRLVYNPSTNLFYTQDGPLKPTFDVSKLVRPDKAYSGYKSMIVTGAYAVVYFEDGYKYCYREDDKLVLES